MKNWTKNKVDLEETATTILTKKSLILLEGDGYINDKTPLNLFKDQTFKNIIHHKISFNTTFGIGCQCSGS